MNVVLLVKSGDIPDDSNSTASSTFGSCDCVSRAASTTRAVIKQTKKNKQTKVISVYCAKNKYERNTCNIIIVLTTEKNSRCLHV